MGAAGRQGERKDREETWANDAVSRPLTGSYSTGQDKKF
ncbi:hypothetical protein CANDROIZ_300003 [Candidatus Roizmanbacteria bacterium]|nr:hypothetical protein CANDROIZ_300003 [Candidatus Roizmanbacteria bacterium]